MSLKGKNLLTLIDYSKEEIEHIIEQSMLLKQENL